MPSLLELIKKNAVPASMMRSAARGALSVPPAEMLQILIYLTRNKSFGEEAALTLAQWDPTSALSVVSSPEAPWEVIEYFWDEKNRRPALMPALMDNPRLTVQRLIEIAPTAPRELVNLMLASRRVRGTQAVLQVLLSNPFLTQAEIQQLQEQLAAGIPTSADQESEAAHEVWRQEHEAEISAEEGKAFELTGSPDEDPESAPAVAAPQSATQIAEAAVAAHKKPVVADQERLTTLQKVARMNCAERVKLAFLGSKEERSILIRDGAKIVQNAVLASPKLSDPEVEMYAAAKHVSENVLREITRSRRFMKNYSVVRNLVNNPRCPIDISLTLIKNLLVYDLKSLRHSKSVPDTVRKVAEKLYKEKMDARSQQQG